MNDERINAAIRYLLQLAVEFETDGASYTDGAEVLEEVANALEEHRTKRLSMKRIALVAELVEPIHEQVKLMARGPLSTSLAYDTISKCLRRVGIRLQTHEVAQLLEQPVRSGARKRTERERLLDRLASLLDISQSQFEKIVGVVERGKETRGRLGTPLVRKRAALDASPTQTELLLYALHALDIDQELGQKMVGLIDTEQIERMRERVDARLHAAEVLAAAKQAPSPSLTASARPKRSPTRTGRR